jgi:hypothetical protein
MPLPHFTNLIVNGNPGPGGKPAPHEVLYKNLFEITFILPTILQAQGEDLRNPILLMQNATKVNFNLTEFDIAEKEQRFKYSTRVFLTTPTKTSGSLSIPFQVNVNDAGSVLVWNTLKAWYDLVFDYRTGALHYKSDLIGTIIVNYHDKKGIVLRRVTFQNVQLKKIGGWEMDWAANDIIDNLSVDFVYDYFIDEYIDAGLGIDTPLVPGYPAP